MRYCPVTSLIQGSIFLDLFKEPVTGTGNVLMPDQSIFPPTDPNIEYLCLLYSKFTYMSK